MPSLRLDPNHEAFVDQVVDGVDRLEGESDRGCALVAGAVIDELLGTLLRSYLDDEPAGLLAALLDRPTAPLGTFAVRIKILRALGVFSVDLFHDLELIRDLRNLAAHFDRRKNAGFATGFSSTVVISKCRRFKCLPKKWPRGTTPRVAFEVVTSTLAGGLGEHAVIWKVHRDNLDREETRQGMHELLGSLDVRLKKTVHKALRRIARDAKAGNV